MELIRYWRVLRRWAWLLVLCPLVAGLAAGVVSVRLPNIYEAQVSVLVRPSQLLSPGLGGAALTIDQILHSYARLATERPLLEQVISEQGLHTDPTTLSHQITVTPEPTTAILDVAVRDTDAVRARDIANRLVDDLIAEVKSFQKAEASAPTANTADNLRVVSSAVTPDQPISPRPLLNIGLGILVGLVAGFGLAFLLDYMDQSVRSDEILRERVGLVPLGHIAYIPAKADKRGELVTLGPDSPVVEAYKSLRTNLLFSSVDKDVKTIVITSAVPNEGKSRTAANLAIVLAQAGHSTLLVDADFRRPSQHRIFGRIRNLGLSNLIVQDMPQSALFVPDEQIANLVVLGSGPTPPNPSELLGSGHMKALLSKFRQGFDFVIIDTPPVNAVTDASVLATNADAVILVIDTNKASITAVLHAKQALERVGGRVLGTVMNKMKATGGNYYYTQYDYSYTSAANGKVVPSRPGASTKEELPAASDRR